MLIALVILMSLCIALVTIVLALTTKLSETESALEFVTIESRAKDKIVGHLKSDRDEQIRKYNELRIEAQSAIEKAKRPPLPVEELTLSELIQKDK